jgi:hypothetical protein
MRIDLFIKSAIHENHFKEGIKSVVKWVIMEEVFQKLS